MRDVKGYVICLWALFIFFCFNSNGFAEDKVSILEHNIKAVATVSSGKYIKLAWSVKLKNQINEAMTCVVSFSFLDGNKVKLGTANKTSTLEPNESKTISDTVVISTSLAQRIANGEVTVVIDKS